MINPYNHGNPWTIEQEAKVWELKQKKLTHREIACRIGRTKSSVAQRFPSINSRRKRDSFYKDKLDKLCSKSNTIKYSGTIGGVNKINIIQNKEKDIIKSFSEEIRQEFSHGSTKKTLSNEEKIKELMIKLSEASAREKTLKTKLTDFDSQLEFAKNTISIALTAAKKFKAIAKKQLEIYTPPPYWNCKNIIEKNFTEDHFMYKSLYVKKDIQNMLRKSVKSSSSKIMKNVIVKKVERLENIELWTRYCMKKFAIVRCHPDGCKPLEKPITYNLTSILKTNTKINEFYLWHGLKNPDNSGIIKKQGLDERVASLKGQYGGGCYFAENSDKSEKYMRSNSHGQYCILLCRVLIGDWYSTKTTRKEERRPPEKEDGSRQLYDSVFAERYHNEYVVYDGAQVYPEYFIWI